MAETFLERIVVATRARLAERQAMTSLESLRDEALRQPPALDFRSALRPTDGGVRAIAEIKRASPSKGALRPALDPVHIGESYTQAGAAAISVLTEQDFFKGSLDDLRAVKRSQYGAAIPVLRKDFITDAYQVVEARAAGADSFLLIVALLDDQALGALLTLGRELGMEALVEAHDDEEALRAVNVGAQIIGVNARDLRTFTVDTTLLRRIRPLIPADVMVVAESGIATMSDVARMRGYGAQCILVGEALMRAEDPGGALRQISALPPALRMVPARPTPVVKLCGMRTPEAALTAYEAGADLISMIFASAKRQVTIAIGRAIVDSLPADMPTVGVFIADSAARRVEIEDTIQQTGIKIAQLCGAASDAWRDLPVPSIFANHQLDLATVLNEKALPLIDSAAPGVWGGTGKVGDWHRAADFARQFPIILAGGLTPDNIGAAIHAVKPWAVDVSSGIENADGEKEPARMQAFVQAVRATAE